MRSPPLKSALNLNEQEDRTTTCPPRARAGPSVDWPEIEPVPRGGRALAPSSSRGAGQGPIVNRSCPRAGPTSTRANMFADRDGSTSAAALAHRLKRRAPRAAELLLGVACLVSLVPRG